MHKLEGLSTRAPKELDKKTVKEETLRLLEQLDGLQELLYAQSKYSVLVILQGMDASGKDGVVKKVFGHLNPMGVHVTSFKTPTAEEKAHDFLWRIHRNAPPKGLMQVFNRSHYEDVLITRVHGWCDDETARKRFSAINHFEKLLTQHNDTIIFKFYLHISQEEQAERFKERVEDPAKQWKYNAQDAEEAKLWDSYRAMYEDAFQHCDEVPWQIIPADQNWYKEYLIARTVTEALASLDMKYPDRAF